MKLLYFIRRANKQWNKDKGTVVFYKTAKLINYAKGYWIANLDVHDMEGFARYRDANREIMTQCGAKLLEAHGQQIVEEPLYRSMQTLVEFASYKDAIDCHDSTEYQAAAKIRQSFSEGSLVDVEGYEGPQGLDL